MKGRFGLFPAALALILDGCAVPEPLPVQAMPAADSATCPRLRPLSRVYPYYPKHALAVRQGGWVLVEFDLPGNGVPENVRVFLASPPDVFDEVAVRAVAKFRYRSGMSYKGCLADIVFTMK